MNEAVRRWAWPVGLALAVLAAGVIIALLQPSPSVYLDPGSTGPDGAHALADLLTARGQRVVRAAIPPTATPPAATASAATPPAATPPTATPPTATPPTASPPAVGTTSPGTGGSPTTGTNSLELITSPNLLTGAQLAQAARFDGDIVLVDPDSAALRAIAPAVRVVANGEGGDVILTPPACGLEAASLAGDIETGGAMLRAPDAAAVACYPGDGGYGLIQYPATITAQGNTRSRTITVLASGAPLTNAYLADDGDAALALNLLRHADGITWVVPSAAAAPPAGGTATGQQKSFFALIPWPVYLIAIQLAVAAVLAAAWRARRLGPLVAERLPVIVRASETVEGHGRLYHARRARDRAAQELRAAARMRIGARTGQPPGTITAPELDGPPPATDTDLVALAADLDELERKVRNP